MPRPITPSCAIYLPEEVGLIEIPPHYKVSGVASSHVGSVVLEIIDFLGEMITIDVWIPNGHSFSAFELFVRWEELKSRDVLLGLADLERVRTSPDALPDDWQRFYFLFVGERLDRIRDNGEEHQWVAHYPYLFHNGKNWQRGIVPSNQEFGQLAKLLRIKNGQV